MLTQRNWERGHLLSSARAPDFFARANGQVKTFMPGYHLIAGGTLIQARVSATHFRTKNGTDDRDGSGSGGQVGFHARKMQRRMVRGQAAIRSGAVQIAQTILILLS
jgi:hypothetical protein